MQRTKKQHYVPQAALRRFSQDSEKIFVYDKIKGETRLANVRDVAQQRYFYDIPKEAIPAEFAETIDQQMIEHTLSEMEGDFNHVVNRVIKRASSKRIFRKILSLGRGKQITRHDKSTLSFFVALQFLRTREFRLTIKDSLEQLETIVRNFIPPDKLDEVYEDFRSLDDTTVRMHHLSLMFDREFINDLTRRMSHHILILGINQSQHRFYTSDNPMVRKAHKKHPVLRNIGVSSPGIEIAMPLSSDYILIFLERRYFAKLARYDRKTVNLSGEQIEYYNSLQVRGCERQVYCAHDDFDVAREFCRQWPERCAEERKRVAVR